jgi:hypothetical protein
MPINQLYIILGFALIAYGAFTRTFKPRRFGNPPLPVVMKRNPIPQWAYRTIYLGCGIYLLGKGIIDLYAK